MPDDRPASRRLMVMSPPAETDGRADSGCRKCVKNSVADKDKRDLLFGI
jgi:hypothetical protein